MANFNYKAIIFLIFSFLIVLSPNDLSAAETVEESSKQEITLEESTHDLMNRFILGFFGKDALAAFETKNISNFNEINDADELARLASPFPYLYTKIQFIFYAVYTLSFLSFSFYLVFVLYLGIFRSQSSGNFLGQSWNITFTLIKVAISLILITPIAGYEQLVDNNGKKISNPIERLPTLNKNLYSTSQMIAFKMAGYSNFYGRQLNDNLIDNQPNMFPSLQIPHSDSKMLELKSLLNFMICNKTNIEAKPDIEFNVSETEGGVNIESNNGKCQLSFDMGIDFESHKIVEEEKELFDIIGDYKVIQKEIIIQLFKDLIAKANMLSDNIIVQSKDNIDIDDSRFLEYLKGGTKGDDATYWENHCESIYNYNVDANLPLNNFEVQQYAFMGLRCLSYEVNKKIILPNVNNIESFLDNGNYLKNRAIDLCNTEYDFGEDKKTATIIADQDKLDTIEINSSNTNSFKFLDILTCVKESCSNLNPDNEYTGLYSCSNSIMVYKKSQDNEMYKDLGVISLAANIFRIFSTHNPMNAKAVYNNLKTVESGSKDTGESLSSPDKFVINITKLNDYEYIYDDFKNIDYLNVESSYFNDIDFGYMASLNKFLGIEKGGVFGSARLVSCIQYPMTIHDGYNCGSVTEEYTAFGKGLLSTSVQYFALSTILKTLPDVGTINTKKTSGGSISSGNAAKEVLLVTVKAITKFIGAPVAIDFLFDSTTQTDEFGDLTSKDLSFMKYSEEFVAYISAISSNSTTSFIDTGFSLLGYLGILFAYVIPFYPFYIALGLFFEWFLLFLNVLILIPFCSAYILKPSENHLNKVFTTTFSILFSLFLKIPFLILGLMLGWILANTAISRIMGLFDFSEIVVSSGVPSITGLINPIIMLFVYGIILFMFTNVAINVMDKLYHFATDWMVKVLSGSQLKNTPDSFFKNAKGMSGNAAGFKNSSAGKNISARFGSGG